LADLIPVKNRSLTAAQYGALADVPLTLGDFHDFLTAGRGRLGEMPALLRQLLIECRAKANQDAAQWKQSINSIVMRRIASGRPRAR
jgi:hypothetical protein